MKANEPQIKVCSKFINGFYKPVLINQFDNLASPIWIYILIYNGVELVLEICFIAAEFGLQ